ncbi:sigma-70 family RNA polymerase sigma factor [Candidatus Uhrbacteria bacterium]|nr:sigma-70 family RNA polymerase sigma factor [Candidatus Uhrbacteria bacterium]
MEQSDAQLIHAYRGGDARALEQLVVRHLQVAYRVAYRVVANTADAEDVVQDAFLKMWQHLHRFDSTRPFRPWLLEIVRNTALDQIKKKQAIPMSHNTDRADEHITDDRNDYTRALDAQGIWERGMALLSRGARQVLEFYYQGTYTFQEIADMLGEPLHTVKSRHRRAILTLRRLLS